MLTGQWLNFMAAWILDTNFVGTNLRIKLTANRNLVILQGRLDQLRAIGSIPPEVSTIATDGLITSLLYVHQETARKRDRRTGTDIQHLIVLTRRKYSRVNNRLEAQANNEDEHCWGMGCFVILGCDSWSDDPWNFRRLTSEHHSVYVWRSHG